MKKNFRTSRTLKRYILSYLCILVFPLLIVSIFVYNYVLDVLGEEVRTNNLHSLQRAQGTIETQMEYILSLENRVYLEKTLKPFSLQKDSMTAIEIQEEFADYLRSNPFLYDMAYYQESDDYIVTALSSCRKEQFFDGMYQYEDWGYDAFRENLKDGVLYWQSVQQVTMADGRKKRLVTVVQPLGSAPYDRCVIYLIDSSFLTAILPDSEESKAAAVMTSEGKILACTGEESLVRGIPAGFFSGAGTQDYASLQNERYLISYVYSEETQWIYLSLVPGASIADKVEHVRLLNTIMFLLVLTGGGIGAYFLAKSNYAPIRNLEEYTNTILENKEAASEINHITSVLEYLNQQNKRLSTDDELKVSALQTLFMDRFLAGWYEDGEQIRQSAQKAGICFDKQYYRIAIFYLYYFPAGTEPAVEEVFRSSVPRGIDVLVKMRLESKKVFVIASYDQPSDDKLERYLSDMVDILQSELQIKSTSALGSRKEYLEKVSQSCREAVEALEYHIILCNQKLIYYEEIALRGNSGFSIAPKNLKGFIKNKNADGMESFLNAALDEMCWKKANINKIVRQCNDFIQTIQDTIEDVNRDYFMENPLYDDISGIIKYENCHELMEIIRLIGCDIIDHLNALSGNTTIEAMFLYIQENGLSCDFSTAAMAENFKMSLPYLSQYFKNHVGSNLLDYVTDRKMEKAKELLTDTSLPVRDVAVQVGYYNVNSFQRRFKQITGCTPGEYRKRKE